MRSPAWTRDEVILALDLYLAHQPRIPMVNDPSVIELSAMLNELSSVAMDKRPENFRSPGSIILKLSNLRALDPLSDATGLPSVSRTDRETWEEFSLAPDKLAAEVRRIRTNRGGD